jgi:Mg2+ and Co2+ transporter CorA
MEVRWISGSGIEPRSDADIPAMLQRDDGFLWVDVPTFDGEATHVLSDVFHLHPHAIQDCADKQYIPKIITYPDHVFLILHGIQFGPEGRGHLLELDQFVGDRFLITVHGPLGREAQPDAAHHETAATLRRIQAGKFLPANPPELAHAIVSMLVLRLQSLLATVAQQVAKVERTIVKAERQDPEHVLDQLFRLRHQLLAIKTTASLSREAFAGRLSMARSTATPERLALIQNLMEQYERLKYLCDGEKEFLDQVLEFHQARTVTKMNIAMQRLALIAAVVLPVTAISGIYGMNLVVNTETDFAHVAVVVAVMGVIAGLMLRWAKRHGWW